MDDGAEPDIDADPATGLALDSFFTYSLTTGDYTLVLSQSNNYPGITLTDPFSRQGEGNFTQTYGCGTSSSNYDFACNIRASQYFVEVLNVAAVPPPPLVEPPVACGGTEEPPCETSPVPIPPASYLFLAGLLALSRFRAGRAIHGKHPELLIIAYGMLELGGVTTSANAAEQPITIQGNDAYCTFLYAGELEAKAAAIWDCAGYMASAGTNFGLKIFSSPSKLTFDQCKSAINAFNAQNMEVFSNPTPPRERPSAWLPFFFEPRRHAGGPGRWRSRETLP